MTFNTPPSQPQTPIQNPSPPKNAPATNPNPPKNAPVQNPKPPTNAPVTNPNPPRNGTFTGTIQIPSTAAPGPAQLCAKGVFATTCTPITINPGS